jgi:hypothetical protein
VSFKFKGIYLFFIILFRKVSKKFQPPFSFFTVGSRELCCLASVPFSRAATFMTTTKKEKERNFAFAPHDNDLFTVEQTGKET